MSCLKVYFFNHVILIFLISLSGLALAEDAGDKVLVPNLKPGKLDITLKTTDASTDYNFILWTPTVKGGFGMINLPGTANAKYMGAFIRPLQPFKDKGELLLGFNYTRYAGMTNPRFNRSWGEFQGEYRFKFGLGIGAGFVDAPFFESPAGPQRTNDYFAKLSYRKTLKDRYHFIISPQIQEVGSTINPGAYAAFYEKRFFAAGGYDGESWRADIGFVSQAKDKFITPAAELLFIDKGIGDNEIAPKMIWANATLKFKGGFLSHGARLGRAMGATGVEYGNPLAHLIPLTDGNPLFSPLANPTPAIWNRALNVWELGGLANFRWFHLALPNDGGPWGKGEMVMFPLQFFKNFNNFLNNVFIGANYFYFENAPAPIDKRQGSLMGGFVERIGPLHVTFELEHNFNSDKTSMTAGIIHWFK